MHGFFKGDVLCDDISRRLYSTDASIFQVKPAGVVAPRDEEDVCGLVRYAQTGATSHSTVTLMHYDGHWNSTDQVPEHLIDTGVIGRYGSIAPTDRMPVSFTSSWMLPSR